MQAREIRRYSVEEYFTLDEAAPEGPDIVVSCEPSYDGMHLTNPELIVEVLSPGDGECPVHCSKRSEIR